ncbi:MAG: ATP-binding protein [Bdellovibrionaceae bacterium]|nr:ATP-binding protein [Pseudobdellovibrionaceae bacterium]
MSLKDLLRPENRAKSLILLRFLIAVGVGVILAKTPLDAPEAWLYDVRMRLRPSPPASEALLLAVADPNSVRHFGESPNLEHYSLAAEKLSAAGAEMILLTVRPSDLETPKEKIVTAIQRLNSIGRFAVLTDDLQQAGEQSPLRLPPPYQDIPLLSAPKTSDRNLFARDGVTRRMLISYQGRDLGHLNLARLLRPDLKVENIRGRFNLYESEQVYVNFRRPGAFPRLTLHEILSNTFNQNAVRGKIVFLGPDHQRASQDYISTPYSRAVNSMSLPEMHANMVQTLIAQDQYVPLPASVNMALTILICLITVHVVFALRPVSGLLVLGLTATVTVLVSGLLFWPGGIWMNLIHPLVAVFLCYYFFIPYRLIIENRRTWEIYQKHKILQQVEELKSNFISMMSHDLKTPIARIIGMTDVILKDNNPVSSAQREALDTIRQSSEDLLKFINAILQYGKIESQNVQLHLQIKDPNALIREVVSKHEFMAKLKRIQIRTELEPLFPCAIDPDLFKQIIANLIENAIKYSPEETAILVSSEEVDGWVIIQVADQGPGIPADELPHLFMKFYRSKSARTSGVKGSGLGLYLSKYFTELHGGSIHVESSYGAGTTFTVKIPCKSGSSSYAESPRR